MIVSLNVKRLADLWSPYHVKLWGRYSLSLSHVRWCQEVGFLLPPDAPTCHEDNDAGFLSHAARVAWLAGAYRLDPIQLVACRDVHPIRDGNHRLAAAISKDANGILVNYHGPADLLDILSGDAQCPWEQKGDYIDHLFAGAWWKKYSANLPTLGEADLSQKEQP